MARQEHVTHHRKSRAQWLIWSKDVDLLGKALLPTIAEGGRMPTNRSGRPPPGTPQAFDAAYGALVKKIVPLMQSHLDSMVGRDFGPDANADFARSVTRLLVRLGCGIQCPCGKIARAIRYKQVRSGQHSYFRFEYEHGAPHGHQRHRGSTTIPPLKMVLKHRD